MRSRQRTRVVVVATALLVAALGASAAGCGARRSRPASATSSGTEPTTEAARVVLPADVPGDGYTITLGDAGSLVLQLPSGADYYEVVGGTCDGLATDRAPVMGGRVTVPGAGARGLAVTMDDRLFAVDLPEVPTSSGLTVTITSAAFSGGDHLHGDLVQSCSSVLSAWAADPTGERTSPEALAAAATTERDAEAVAAAEIVAGECNAESLRLIGEADSNIDTLLHSAHLIRGHREHGVGTSEDVLRGITVPATATYHVLIGSWQPVELAVAGRDGTATTESPFARLLEGRGWSVASRTFAAEEGARFALRISTRGCFAVYVYFELP